MPQLPGKDRLIVALDVPTAREALDLVQELQPEVSFFKIGWQLLLSGELPRILEALQAHRTFLDLKVPGDIRNTIQAVVAQCVTHNVQFLTLSSDIVPIPTIEAASEARGDRAVPKLLMVPFLSSLDESDLQRIHGRTDLDTFLLERAADALSAGCDGLIVSGAAIAAVRQAHPAALIVSPGIRPAEADRQDHKRVATPGEAIGMGADYLVVGRPIREASDPGEAAQRIIREIDGALEQRGGTDSARRDTAVT